MGFTAGWMLFWLGAASIPIIIHLLNRRRHRVINWGAMRFLKLSFITRHRRLRIEELLLLILRTLLIAALVMALAGPFFANELLSQRPGRDVVILLDSSFSMSLRDRQTTLFARARAEAEKIIDGLSGGDSVSVIAASRTPRMVLPQPVYDFERAKNALPHSASLDSLDILKNLNHAISVLKKGINVDREIVIITDGQRHGWFTRDESRWRYLIEALESMKRKPRIFVLNVTRDSSVDNLGLGEIDLKRTVVGTDRDVRITVNVSNKGDLATGKRRISFAVDGKSPWTTGVKELDAGKNGTVSFSHRFVEPGGHYIKAELEHDQLPPDDKAYFGLEVLDELPVLLIDGSPFAEAMKKDTLFLASALEPTPAYVVNPTVIGPAELAKTDLGKYRAVVLANVPKLSRDVDIPKLERFVKGGGGLLIAPGTRVKLEDYNRDLWQNGAGLLPVKILAVVGDEKNREEFLPVATNTLTHETLQLLADPERSDMDLIKVYKHFKLAVPTTGSGASILMRLVDAGVDKTGVRVNDGDPLIVEKDFGRGRVMLIGCPLDMSWSNLPRRSSFVVLVHELIYYLSSPLLPARNVRAGDALIVELAEGSPANEVEFTTPLMRERKIPVERREGRRVAIFTDTREGGLYQITYAGRRGPVNEYYVVNFDPDESDLSFLKKSSQEVLSAKSGITFFSNWHSLEVAMRAGKGKTELWRWVALLVLALLLLEVFLTRLFSKRRAADVQGAQFGTG